MKYKHVIITRPGDPAVLKTVEDDLPDPQPGEVQVKVSATTVAFTDVMMREGVYPGVPKLPYTPGYSIVGIVDRLGVGTRGWALGQRVAALTVIGGYGEYLCVPAADLVPVPMGVDTAEAVSLVLQYVTAYQLLHRVALVQPGDRILIHGAAGGVGTALLQLGKLAGLEMYGTESTAKLDRISLLGGIPIDDQRENFVDRIRQLTGDGVDAVFDSVGGSHLLRSYQTLKSSGCLVSYGFLSAFRSKFPKTLAIGTTFLILGLLNLIRDRRQANFYSISRSRVQHRDRFRDDLTHLFDLLERKQIRPQIADRLPLTAAARAHELLDRSAVEGNLVLMCDSKRQRDLRQRAEGKRLTGLGF